MNLVLITSTVQVGLSELHFKFDDIRNYFLEVLRDCRQITFAKLGGFCPLSKKTHFMFLTDNIKMERILTKTFWIVFKVLKVLLIKNCKMESLDLSFLVVFISFYIGRYFSQIFRTSFNSIWKKVFVINFLFLTDSLNHPTPSLQPLRQSPLNVTKVLPMLPNLSY